MTTPELLSPSSQLPLSKLEAVPDGALLFTSPSLLEIVRWIDARHANSLALLERTDAGWSVTLFDGDPPSPASVLQASSAPFERRDRSHRRRG